MCPRLGPRLRARGLGVRGLEPEAAGAAPLLLHPPAQIDPLQVAAAAALRTPVRRPEHRVPLALARRLGQVDDGCPSPPHAHVSPLAAAPAEPPPSPWKVPRYPRPR